MILLIIWRNYVYQLSNGIRFVTSFTGAHEVGMQFYMWGKLLRWHWWVSVTQATALIYLLFQWVRLAAGYVHIRLP